jgi:diaminohydroxyphosphoribosylaminopyrimidine deaminase/5-amino-6-(5-phosphoribosylamino)uracil reductase
MVEGGGRLLGAMFDRRWIDEVHVFIAAKLAGGLDAVTPIAGEGIGDMTQALHLVEVERKTVEDDTYLHGVVRYPEEADTSS